MNTVLFNMIRIFDGDNVVVLDKKKKEGWEGLTFPGGHIELKESFTDSVIREAKEETNLDIRNVEFDGIIQWYDLDTNDRYVGYLYTSREYDGDLISNNREGRLYFQNYQDFINEPVKSESMDYILKVYEKECSEIVLYYLNGKLDHVKEF